jgi:hypothetical protein
MEPVLTELQRQHAAHKERHARFAAAAIEQQSRLPIRPLLVQGPSLLMGAKPKLEIKERERPAPDLHMVLYRMWIWEKTTVGAEVTQYIRSRCLALGVNYLEIIGGCRLRMVAEIRQLLMWELRTLFNLSFSKIGLCFMERDHTTALHAVRKVEAQPRLQVRCRVKALSRQISEGNSYA